MGENLFPLQEDRQPSPTPTVKSDQDVDSKVEGHTNQQEEASPPPTLSMPSQQDEHQTASVIIQRLEVRSEATMREGCRTLK